MNPQLKALLLLITIGVVITVIKKLLKKTNKSIENLKLEDTHKLMIVAHPDDETIWGGAELLKDNYLVVCITCGSQKTRVNEFEKVMKLSNNKYLMLGYPDKKNNKRDDWRDYYFQICHALRKIINYKDWDLIITHNPDGEYGHEHHKMTSKIVTNILKNKDKLYYFGKYYEPSKMKAIKNNLTKVAPKYLDIKINKMIEVYKSQSFIKKTFSHMFEYENWNKASDWNSEN